MASEAIATDGEPELDPVTGRPFIPGVGTHVPPDGADWEEHPAGLDCLAHMEHARAGEVPFGGQIVPEWRKRIAERPPTAEWWRRRHHCSDVVLGQHPDTDDPS